MKTILLTVSPSEAVGLLNGTLATLIRSWSVPLGTAYIAVKKEKPYVSEWHREEPPRFFIPTKTVLWIDKIFGGVNYLNGLVVAKCEINSVMQYPTLHLAIIYLSNLSVLDKPMEVKQFYTRKCKAFKATGTDLKHSLKIEYTRTSLSRLPSRWQAVEVGE